jgi:hypothetical protein
MTVPRAPLALGVPLCHRNPTMRDPFDTSSEAIILLLVIFAAVVAMILADALL